MLSLRFLFAFCPPLLMTPPGHISKHYLSALPVHIFTATRSFIYFDLQHKLSLSLCGPLDGEKRRDLKEVQPHESAN